MTVNPVASALAGLNAATQRFAASADKVSRWNTDGDVDLAHEMAEQIQAKTAFAANLATLKTADEMMGAVLDLKA